jgi:hypothetical protein
MIEQLMSGELEGSCRGLIEGLSRYFRRDIEAVTITGVSGRDSNLAFPDCPVRCKVLLHTDRTDGRQGKLSTTP